MRVSRAGEVCFADIFFVKELNKITVHSGTIRFFANINTRERRSHAYPGETWFIWELLASDDN